MEQVADLAVAQLSGALVDWDLRVREIVALRLGRKTVRSGDPAEKTERDILEVLVALPPEAVVLPIGLRVTVRFMPKQ